MNETANQHSITVYEERVLKNLEVSEEDITEYSQRLGIDLQGNPALASLIRDWILQPLPQYWFPCREIHSNNWFYFNALSGQSSWYHPLQEIHQKLANEFCFKAIEERQNPEGQSAEDPSMESVINPKESHNASRNQLPRVLAPLKRVGNANSNELPIPSRGNQLSPITLPGANQGKLDSENVRKVSFSTFKPAISVKAPDPVTSKDSRDGTINLNNSKSGVSNLSFTERLAAKKGSRGALSERSLTESEPISDRKRVQFDANLKEVRTYTPDVSEESKSSSSDFLDFICDPGQLKPFTTPDYPVHFEDERWNVGIKSFAKSKSNLIANGEMMTSFNSSDEEEQLELVETRFPSVQSVQEDVSAKEIQSDETNKTAKKSNSESKFPHPESSITNSSSVPDKAASKNSQNSLVQTSNPIKKDHAKVKLHRSESFVTDQLLVPDSKSSKIDKVDLKANLVIEENGLVNSNTSSKESQKVIDRSHSVVKSHGFSSSVEDRIPTVDSKSPKSDADVTIKNDQENVINLSHLLKESQKLNQEIDPVVKLELSRGSASISNMKTRTNIENNLSRADEVKKDSNVLTKESRNDYREPQSVHNAQEPTREKCPEAAPHRSRSSGGDSIPVVDLETSRANSEIDLLQSKAELQSVHTAQKVTNEYDPEMKIHLSGSNVNPIRERKALIIDSGNVEPQSVHIAQQLITHNKPEVNVKVASNTEVELIDKNSSEDKLENAGKPELKLAHANSLEVKLADKKNSEAKLETENETQQKLVRNQETKGPEVEIINGKKIEAELENESKIRPKLTRDKDLEINKKKESRVEVDLHCKNAASLESDNSSTAMESIGPSGKEVVDAPHIQETESTIEYTIDTSKVSDKDQRAAKKDSLPSEEWLLMKQELECKLNDEKLRLQRWFSEELASIKSKFESDLDQQKANIVKEDILLRMEDKLSQLIDVKQHHDVNIQTEELLASHTVKEAPRESDFSVRDEGKRCCCESLEKQVARVEREMQLLKERKLSFGAKKSTSKKNGPIKAKRESWWLQSDESSSTLSSSFSEWKKPLKEPSLFSASRSATPLQRARSILSKHQMQHMHRKSWLDEVSTDESSDTPTSGISSAFSNGDWNCVLNSIHKISSDLRQVSTTIGHRSRSKSFSGIEDNCWMPSTSSAMANGRVSLQWPVSGSTAQRTRALRQWLQHNQHSPSHFL